MEDDKTANHYLEACGYELDKAVNLYFNRANGERDAASSPRGGRMNRSEEMQDDDGEM